MHLCTFPKSFALYADKKLYNFQYKCFMNIKYFRLIKLMKIKQPFFNGVHISMCFYHF